ncbi:MAG: DNA repair protein RadA [Bacteroidales bacterium]|nr:DNA repair protein RadA [Bacteroidales bacterium]
MAKSRVVYYCQNCGAQASKWIGKCPSCGEWNTYVEEIIRKEHPSEHRQILAGRQSVPIKISDITSDPESRIKTADEELNRVLGGGVVPGSLVLIGGEPGIGKSTLMLQIALSFKKTNVLYVTGEESQQQIKMRAERIGLNNQNCYILPETNTQNIFKHISELNPEILILDSVQTLYTDTIESSAGSISQIRECASEFQKFAKQTDIPVFLIGHITKDGLLAGPKVLEHMVDTVLQFEGERNYGYRIVRSIKNRFGSTSELGIYEMKNSGLQEVPNPSEILLSHRDENFSGIAIASMVEGIRPMLIETQALVSSSAYGTPQRSTTGFDIKRLNMLLAVLEKKSGFRIGAKDVFLNITGGLKVYDPAIDLAVVAAIMSSNKDIPVDQNICFAGEVGLSGEIRSVNRIEQRISEADKLGFDQIIVSKYNLKNIEKSKYHIEVIPIGKITDLFKRLF